MSRALGNAGEGIAESFLAAKGGRLLARSYAAAGGEIDLIFDMGGVIAFVEVKLRRFGAAGDGAEAVTPQKRRRITRAALSYIQRYKLSDRRARFDVVEITPDGVKHIEAAFEAAY